ncbi:hypothetical protein LQF12_11890 [Ruania suaedae]|uniref:hypothetical protein n=1 Tax=Ruania suaedae TaxID=2897774 RepID=UPI001E4D658E|nr:hypothetical protein [Ruania suaedae]UFU02206.1 hypothetical protein LQF12_11890 [Ruania suaedae]
MSADTHALSSVPAAELDGVLALRAVLRAGLDAEVYPRQVCYVPAGDGAELSFVHGLPGTSGLGPVTFAQDKRMRRGLLERNGVPVPSSATFTIGKGVKAAKRTASILGYPVVVKPAVGDNGIETFRDIHDDAGIDAALEYLRNPTSEREGFNRSAYGLTELREPGEENGRIVVPPGYMFMVEKQLEGEYLRILVSDGEVRSIVRCHGAPSDGSMTGGEDVTEDAHEDVRGLALRASAGLPGLGLCSIDMVVPDVTAPFEESTVGVVEFSERAGLSVQAKVDPALAERLSEEVVHRYASASGWTVAEPIGEVDVAFEAHSLPDPDRGGEAIAAAATAIGLASEITRIDTLGGLVEGRFSGEAGLIARLTNELLDGDVEQQSVMLVVLRPLTGAHSGM